MSVLDEIPRSALKGRGAVGAPKHRFTDEDRVEVDDGWWRDELERDLARRGIAADVSLHGHVTDGERDRLLAEAWLMLLPSVKEGWGLAVLEAAVQGGRMAGDMRANDYKQATDLARARDMISQYNVGSREKAKYYNAGLPQQQFDNKAKLASGKANAAAGVATAVNDLMQKPATPTTPPPQPAMPNNQIAGKKVIKPLNDITMSTAPDLNALLAKEMAIERPVTQPVPTPPVPVQTAQPVAAPTSDLLPSATTTNFPSTMAPTTMAWLVAAVV